MSICSAQAIFAVVALVPAVSVGCTPNSDIAATADDAALDSAAETSIPEVDAAVQSDAAQVQPEAAALEGGEDAHFDGNIHTTPCVTEVTAGHHRFACSGLEFDVEVPAACTTGGCGLILDVHGLSMSADQVDKNTEMRSRGNQYGYIVVQPTANMGPMGPSWNPWTDDDKVWDFFVQVRDALAVDPKRLHIMGFSQGGAMTWRLTCKHADVLASVAPTAAANAKEWGAVMPPFDLDCRFDLYDSPPAELPILHMHGTIDGLVPFAKGEMQRDAVIEKWSMVQQEVVSESNGHRHTRYVNPNGTVYEFIQHDYHATTGIAPVALIGHCFPGGKDWNTNPSPGELLFFGCEQPNAFVWAELAMQFFLEHPKE